MNDAPRADHTLPSTPGLYNPARKQELTQTFRNNDSTYTCASSGTPSRCHSQFYQPSVSSVDGRCDKHHLLGLDYDRLHAPFLH